MEPERRTALIRGVLSVLTVVVFYSVWSTARLLLYLEYSTDAQLDSPWGGPALWIAVPQLLSTFFMVLIGAFVYGRERLPTIPGAFVVLTLPILVFLLDAVPGLIGNAPANVLFLRLLAVCLGLGVALWLVYPRDRNRDPELV